MNEVSPMTRSVHRTRNPSGLDRLHRISGCVYWHYVPSTASYNLSVFPFLIRILLSTDALTPTPFLLKELSPLSHSFYGPYPFLHLQISEKFPVHIGLISNTPRDHSLSHLPLSCCLIFLSTLDLYSTP